MIRLGTVGSIVSRQSLNKYLRRRLNSDNLTGAILKGRAKNKYLRLESICEWISLHVEEPRMTHVQHTTIFTGATKMSLRTLHPQNTRYAMKSKTG
jgi:hypothetical protein